jgi:hypothetical protein
MVHGIGSANPSDQKIVEVGTTSVRCEGSHKKDQNVLIRSAVVLAESSALHM